MISIYGESLKVRTSVAGDETDDRSALFFLQSAPTLTSSTPSHPSQLPPWPLKPFCLESVEVRSSDPSSSFLLRSRQADSFHSSSLPFLASGAIPMFVDRMYHSKLGYVWASFVLAMISLVRLLSSQLESLPLSSPFWMRR